MYPKHASGVQNDQPGIFCAVFFKCLPSGTFLKQNIDIKYKIIIQVIQEI